MKSKIKYTKLPAASLQARKAEEFAHRGFLYSYYYNGLYRDGREDATGSLTWTTFSHKYDVVGSYNPFIEPETFRDWAARELVDFGVLPKA